MGLKLQVFVVRAGPNGCPPGGEVVTPYRGWGPPGGRWASNQVRDHSGPPYFISRVSQGTGELGPSPRRLNYANRLILCVF